MKITYEPGDYIKVVDNIGAPFESANCELKLIHLRADGRWNAIVVESDITSQIGKRIDINKKWFNTELQEL